MKLVKLIDIQDHIDEWSWHASASQRAEAFLKSLDLWEE